jgi:glycosyltransferase involved in cell wall biosynthesis
MSTRTTASQRLRAWRADLIHITTPGPIGLAARMMARRLDLPVVGSYHTHFGECAEALSGSRRVGHVLERYVRWMYKRCDPLLVPSQATRQMLMGCGYRSDRLRLWTRGVDTTSFNPSRAVAAMREAWQVDDRRPAVIYVGRLSREKGLDLVAPIQCLLDRDRVAHQLVFVGDGPMRARLSAACPGAVFVGNVSHDKVALAMASADVFLFPSATDALGNVVLEAQASGLPVIVSDRGGPQEHLLSQATGEICVAGDACDFAAKLGRLLRAPDRRRRMGRAARQFALSRDWPRSLQPLYDAWLGATRATRARAHLTAVASAGR